MNLEIDLDSEAEQVTLILDNHLVLTASKDDKHIIYGREFSKVEDDSVLRVLKKVAEMFLNL